jgi:Flp pilus assembly protein TadD
MRRSGSASLGIMALCALLAGYALAGAPGERFKQSGMNKYMRKNYAGAVADFDRYLAGNPDDSTIILLRGLSKSLLQPEDVAGACADFLIVKAGLKDMNVEKYCAGQPGW